MCTLSTKQQDTAIGLRGGAAHVPLRRPAHRGPVHPDGLLGEDVGYFASQDFDMFLRICC